MQDKSEGINWTKQEAYGLEHVPEHALLSAGVIQSIESIEQATRFVGYLENALVRRQMTPVEIGNLMSELDRRVISMVHDTVMLKKDIPRLEAYRKSLVEFTQLTSDEIRREILDIIDRKIAELKDGNT